MLKGGNALVSSAIASVRGREKKVLFLVTSITPPC